MNTFGISGLKYLEGMWSFFYYNKKNNQIILSRDLFGEKPLYYSNINKNFYFGSNINYITELSNKKFNLIMKKLIFPLILVLKHFILIKILSLKR